MYITKLLFIKTNSELFIEVTFWRRKNALCYNEVTFLKKVMLYALSKLLFEKTNALRFIEVTS
jgi:hypothetical protein